MSAYNLPIDFIPCVVTQFRWVGYYDATSSGSYQTKGETWVNGYNIATVPFTTGTNGTFNHTGETVPDEIDTGIEGSSAFSNNMGGFANSSAMRGQVTSSGKFWIYGVWYDPDNPGIDYQKICTGTLTSECGGCGSGFILDLPIPPDDLVQPDENVEYDFTQDASAVAAIDAFCATPGACAAGWDSTTPCDTGDPFFGTPP